MHCTKILFTLIITAGTVCSAQSAQLTMCYPDKNLFMNESLIMSALSVTTDTSDAFSWYGQLKLPTMNTTYGFETSCMNPYDSKSIQWNAYATCFFSDSSTTNNGPKENGRYCWCKMWMPTETNFVYVGSSTTSCGQVLGSNGGIKTILKSLL